MFLSAVHTVVKNTPPQFTSVACPDQYVGVVSELDRNAADFLERRKAEERPSNTPCVILVLESPHIKEFVGAPGPAKGATGRLVRRYLHEVLLDEIDPSHGLILVNAVPNQCSLGCPTKEHRDAVFFSAWRLYAKKDFIQRLGALLREKDYVVNACTKGNGKSGQPELRQLVEDAISCIRKQGSNRRVCHPVSWASPLHRNASMPFEHADA